MEHLTTVYRSFCEGCRIVTDSREVQPDDIFIALHGETHNGNRFAPGALAAGARWAVVDETPAEADARYLQVGDTLHFLQELARHHRRVLGLPILAITGTNGKTTTKELCHAVLSARFNTVSTAGNYNNHIGVPLTLLRMNPQTQFGVVEMGANHPGEIDTLCRISEPDYGLITNVGLAHLEGFGSLEGVVRTKGELLNYLKERQGTFFLNSDNPLLVKLAEGYSCITYGKTPAFAAGKVVQAHPFLVVDLETEHGRLYIKTRLVGSYNFDNVMAAVAVGLHLQTDPLAIKKAIEAYLPSNMRSQQLQTPSNTLILDAYNANPSSMQAALAHFAEIPANDKTLILGEMRELGTASAEAHAQLLEQVGSLRPDRVFLVGRSFAALANKYTFVSWFEETDQLAGFLKDHPLQGSLILIKGSRGNRLERIVELL